MSTQATRLTEVDHRLIAQLEALYGPAGPTMSHAGDLALHSPARLPMRRSIIRTVIVVALAAGLVAGTEPGRALYGWIEEGVQTACVRLSATFEQFGLLP